MRRSFSSALLTGTSLLALSFALAAPAQGQGAGMPSGASVAVGQASISAPNATNTLIKQSSQKALINWQNFSIASGSTVTFEQPGSGAITLNRVVGPNASTINGNIFANGQVWIINGNGILFGAGSQINVAGLIATTSDIADQDFINGNYNFGTASANANASVVNQGSIHAGSGGSIVLSASSATNQGLIEANLGHVVLAGGSTFSVDFNGDNLIRFELTAPSAQTPGDGKTLVSNSGNLSADGGTVLLTARAARDVVDNVINSSGIVEATSVSEQNGEIVLDAGNGGVSVSGTLDASGKNAGETGGTVSITGKNVTIADGAQIDASGNSGGGTISIGGDFHGAGPTPDADTASVGNATIDADAIAKGDGGKVALWSNTQTDFAGTISAHGGAAGGNGGTVETSSSGNLQVASSARVDTLAFNGLAGTWLLDPVGNFVIANSGGSISPTTIETNLASGNVTLQSGADIDINDPVTGFSSANTLSLLAQGNIFANASVQNGGTGAINLIAGWDGTTLPPASLTAAGVYGNNGGSVTIGGTSADVAVGSAGGATTVAAANLAINGTSHNAQLGYHGTGSGNIVIDLTGNLTITGGNGESAFDAQIGNGDASGTNSAIGNVSGDISITAGGNTVLTDDDGPGLVWIGNVAGPGHTEAGNLTLITGEVKDGSDSNGGFGSVIIGDLGTVAGTGGNVIVGITNPDDDGQDGVLIDANITYNSVNAFTVLSTGSIGIASPLQNSGSGAITLIAGWNPAVAPANVLSTPGAYGLNDGNVEVGSDFAEGNASVGSKSGTTTIAGADVYVLGTDGYAQIGYTGSGATGAINVYANSSSAPVIGDNLASCTGGSGNVCVVSNGGNGDYAQIGDLGLAAGAGTASSPITVNASGNIVLVGGGLTDQNTAATNSNAYAQIGNGDATKTNADAVSGDINIKAGGTTSFDSSTVASSVTWLGNRAATGGSQSGNVTMISGTSNGGFDSGSRFAEDLVGGNVSMYITNPNIDIVVATNYLNSYSATHTLTYAIAGNLIVESSVENTGTGGINFIAGWDGHTFGVVSLTNAGVYGNNNKAVTVGGSGAVGNVSLGSKGGTTNVAGANVYVSAVNGFAQIGFGGPGATGAINVFAASPSAPVIGDNAASCTGSSGNVCLLSGSTNGDYAQIGALGFSSVVGTASSPITVNASGNIVLVGGGATGASLVAGTAADAYAQIGNGDATKTNADTVSGDINIKAGGTTSFNSSTVPSSVTWLGNRASVGGSQSGNVTMISGTSNGGFDSGSRFAEDLVGGDVTMYITNPNVDIVVATNYMNSYSAAHTLTYAIAGNLIVDSSVENTGTGGINFVAGWDGHTLGVASLTNAGVYGNNNKAVTVGGAAAVGNVSLGSKGGTTTVAGANVYVSAVNGFAQIGFGGPGATGAVNVIAASPLAPVIGDDAASCTGSSGNVCLLSGSTSGDYAQIGALGFSGGVGAASSPITVTASGNIVLVGGGATGASLVAGTTANAYAQIGNGDATKTRADTVSGDINITAGGATTFASSSVASSTAWLGNRASVGGSQSGNITMISGTSNGGFDSGSRFAEDLVGGNVSMYITNPNVDIVVVTNYLSSYSTTNTLTYAIAGNLIVEDSVENTGTGAINFIAGWDGHTFGVASLTNAGVYGNNGKGVTIGGTTAVGNVSLGSKGGTTTVAGAFLTVEADTGYAQLGYQGAGTGTIAVSTTGAVNVTGGTGTGKFAQVGHGGLLTTGNTGGSITIAAGGNVNLTGGSAMESYAQIGDGGAESNKSSAGYSNTAPITIHGNNIALSAGNGTASYAQIGNGGYQAGAGITSGTAANGGDISVTAAGTVTLTGNGAQAYAQIGNGGDLVNTGAAAGAGGSNSGNLVVQTSGSAVTMTAGAGANAYVQIGNGGAGSDAPGTPNNFTDSGTIMVADLGLFGGNSGSNAYAQVGNGDASLSGIGDVSGDITIAAGTITLTDGSAPHSPAVIGNRTGNGTVSGNITGYTPPVTTPIDDSTSGTIASLISTTTNIFTNPTAGAPPGGAPGGMMMAGGSQPNAIENATGGDNQAPTASDNAAATIGDSLNGSHPSRMLILLGGLLQQFVPGTGATTPHGVPPADQDFSSWGNEAFWQ